MFPVPLPGRATVIGSLLLLAAAVHAQPSSAPPNPLDPQAAVPPVTHRSALAGYRPAHEVTVGSWKDANGTVNRIGGWRAYAREAAASDAGATATPPVPAAGASRPHPPAQPPHRHHGAHGMHRPAGKPGDPAQPAKPGEASPHDKH